MALCGVMWRYASGAVSHCFAFFAFFRKFAEIWEKQWRYEIGAF